MPEPTSDATRIFGSRVRENRQRLGISQETLAELSGVHWTFVGQVERGTRNLSLHNIIKIAAGLDIDPSVLVEGIGGDAIPAAVREPSDAERIRTQRKAAQGR
ncbi:MAG: family transcriptional regulator [Glaciihabitans sp.]|jgi:transcriptional regulator with XRE-family HTH domain|nr:family transcriptional regulator [Glaciihabitans sp.]MCU1535263.1 family transcriptional regulator [Glaciihabitans sp.]